MVMIFCVSQTCFGFACDVANFLPEKDAEMSGTVFVDTNDYATFPNFESSEGTTFEVLTRFAPKPSATRSKTDLAAEKLKQIISPLSPEGEKQELLLWLQDYTSTRFHIETEGIYTRAEGYAKQAEEAIALLVREISDKSRWTHEKFSARLDTSSATLQAALEDLTRLLESQSHLVPASFDTLHNLYTAYDVVKTTLDFNNYVSKQSKNVPEVGKTINETMRETARKLLQVLLAKVQVVKKGLDEGGWIDKLLEGSVPEEGSVQATGEVVRGLVDENFLEEWAGLVVESWGESAQGLSLIKPQQ